MREPLRLTLTTAPAGPPVGLDAVKAALRLDDDRTTEDALVMGLVRTAGDSCEAFTGCALVTQTWTLARDLGDEQNAQIHLDKAMHIALGRVKKNPNSASAAYSLGRAYSLMERHGPALEELARAQQLKPSSKKYRKAYHNAKKHVP